MYIKGVDYSSFIIKNCNLQLSMAGGNSLKLVTDFLAITLHV